MVLPHLTMLHDRYAIRSVLGEFGPLDVSYLARDLNSDRRYVIREYFPVRLAMRADDQLTLEPRVPEVAPLFQYGLECYAREAVVATQIDHPNIVREVASFRANATFYRVYEYHSGASLEAVLSQQGGAIPDRVAFAILMPLLEGLHVGHARNLLHGSLSPSKIYLSKSGRPMLLDFSIARLLLGRRLGDVERLFEPGFAAPELLSKTAKLGPWTDVYACAATFFAMLSGQTPPSAAERMKDDRLPAMLQRTPGLSAPLQEVLLHALALRQDDRISSIDALRQQLLDVASSRPAAAKPERPAARPAPAPAPPPPIDASTDDTLPPAPPSRPAATPVTQPVSPPIASPISDPISNNGDGHDPMSLGPDAHAEPPEFKPVRPPDPPPFRRTPPEEKSVRRTAPESSPIARHSDARKVASPDRSTLPPHARTSSPDRDASSRHTPVHVPSARPEPPPDRFGPPQDRYDLPRDRFDSPNDRSDASNDRYEAPDHPDDDLDDLTQDFPVETFASQRRDLPSMPPIRMFFSLLERRRLPVLLLSLLVLVLVVLGLVMFSPFGNEVPSPSLAFNEAPPTETSAAGNTRARGGATTAPALGSYEAFLAAGDSLSLLAEMHLTQGDTAMAQIVYPQAINAYNQALSLQPEDEDARARVREMIVAFMGPDLQTYVDRSVPGATPPAGGGALDVPERDQLYELYLYEGDSLYNTANYRAARGKYQVALEYRPNDSYAASRIQSVDSLLSRASTRALFSQYMSNGDALLAQQSLEDARRAYELAYALQPEDEAVIARLDSINQLLTDAQNREQQYAYHRGQGDALFARGNYDEAMQSYQSALELQPNDAYVTERIQLLEDSIQTESSLAAAETLAATEQYTFHRTQGDSLFELGQFEAADASYRTALTYQPDDAYLNQRLTLIADSLASFQNTIRLTDENGIYLVTDTDPVLLDQRDLYSQVRYPSEARSNDIQGRVTLRMIVHESGTVSNIEIVSEPGYGTGEEAVRVMQQARFQPARYRDRPVSAWHTFSMLFQLN